MSLTHARTSSSRTSTLPRRGRRTAATLAAAGLVATGLATSVAGAAPAAAADGRTFTTMLAQLRGCESGGNYAINTGNGYYGAYQFDAGTWRSVGGSGLPHQNAPAVQDEMATRLYEQRGWSPWPSCSRSLGLYAVPVQRPSVGSAPQGHVDSVVGQPGGIRLAGWAFDRDSTPSATDVHVYVDGGALVVPVRADAPRPDVAAAYGVGQNHGVSTVVPVGPGRHSVCVYVINQGPTAVNPAVHCSEVVVPRPTVGALDRVEQVRGGVRVTGWTLDLDTPDQTPRTHLYSGGAFVTEVTGKIARPDVAAAYGVSRARGYSVVVPRGVDVCAFGIDTTGNASNPLLGCRTPVA